MQVEEKDAPEKVEGQLREEAREALCAGGGGPGAGDAGGADPHEQVEDGPDDRKDDSRRGERRLFEGIPIELRAVPGQKAGERADRLGCENPEQGAGPSAEPFGSFHKIPPRDSLCRPGWF